MNSTEAPQFPSIPSNNVKMFTSFSSSFISKTDLNGHKVENKTQKSFNYSNIDGKEDKNFHGSEFEIEEKEGKIQKYGEIYHKENDNPMHIKQKASSNAEEDKLALKKNNGVVEKDIIDKTEEISKLGEFADFFNPTKNLRNNQENGLFSNLFNFKGFESSFSSRFDSFIKSQMLQ